MKLFSGKRLGDQDKVVSGQARTSGLGGLCVSTLPDPSVSSSLHLVFRGSLWGSLNPDSRSHLTDGKTEALKPLTDQAGDTGLVPNTVTLPPEAGLCMWPWEGHGHSLCPAPMPSAEAITQLPPRKWKADLGFEEGQEGMGG